MSTKIPTPNVSITLKESAAKELANDLASQVFLKIHALTDQDLYIRNTLRIIRDHYDPAKGSENNNTLTKEQDRTLMIIIILSICINMWYFRDKLAEMSIEHHIFTILLAALLAKTVGAWLFKKLAVVARNKSIFEYHKWWLQAVFTIEGFATTSLRYNTENGQYYIVPFIGTWLTCAHSELTKIMEQETDADRKQHIAEVLKKHYKQFVVLGREYEKFIEHYEYMYVFYNKRIEDIATVTSIPK